MWNALLYKIFGVKFGTLYYSGILCSLAIVSGIYLFAKKFMSELLSMSIAVFTIICGVCASHLFNYTLPYSFGMLYGTVGLIYSLLAFIKFKQENKTQYLYLAALLGGFCVSNKYDFFLYAAFLFVVALCTKNKRVILNFITCFSIVPLICGLILFLQGVNFGDYSKVMHDVKSMISSDSIYNFYSVQGIFYNPKIFLMWILNFLKTGLCFMGLLAGVKILDINKIFGWIVVSISAIVLYFITTPAIFIFMLPLLIITSIVCINKLKENPCLGWLLVAVLSVSSKCFWVFLNLNYGNYVVPIVLAVFFAILFTKLDKKYEKAFAIGLLVVGFYYMIDFSLRRSALSYPVSTNRGTIYTFEKNAETTNSLIGGLTSSNVKTAVIYPEGLIINFLTDIKSEDYYNSLLPLYFESFGEDKFINVVKKSAPDVIVLTNQSMSEYGVDFICDNYAQSFCAELQENYALLDDINDGFRYIVYGKK
jgi:hypothetical protein